MLLVVQRNQQAPTVILRNKKKLIRFLIEQHKTVYMHVPDYSE